jgi:hypothetical protein
MGSIALSFSGAQAGEPHVPEKESAIDPINPRGELALLALPQGENRALLAQYWSV